jgi:hypothetical protein
MLLTIVAIWAIVIPLVVLALSWQVANIREARVVKPLYESASRRGTSRPGSVPGCAVPAARARRTTTRRVCPEQPRRAGRRPTSA